MCETHTLKVMLSNLCTVCIGQMTPAFKAFCRHQQSCCVLMHRYPVQAGDAIWMAPYVVHWYAGLGTQRSRYILYKDTTMDALIAT